MALRLLPLEQIFARVSLIALHYCYRRSPPL